jgi:hypothetical protein
MAFERCQAATEINYSLNGNEHLMERPSNNTQWAEKLERVSLPDAGEAWKTMAAVLEKEMPMDQRKRRRSLLVLIFLLILLVGTGYLVWRAASVKSTTGKSSVQVRPGQVSGREERGGSAVGGQASVGEASDGESSGRKTTKGGTMTVVNGASVADGRSMDRETAAKSRMATNRRIMTGEESEVPAGGDPVGKDREGSTHIDGLREPRHSDPGRIIRLGFMGQDLSGISISHANDPLKCPPVEAQKMTRWVAGVGLNQSIPVDGQQFWFNPSGGLNTWWKDYIPVPFVRYYFQPKVFMQAEVRIHAPQYTTRNLWFAYLNDSLNFFGVFIKKLYYLQLPVTIHYAPSPAWSIGLGLQYSHYCSGITALADSLPNSYYSFRPLSDYPMVYARSYEFRGLVSLDYMYRHWIVGVSYDQAFTRAIGVRITSVTLPGPATFTELPPPVRNSSLQLFVRYILWGGRSGGR